MGVLILTRKIDETILIGDDIEIKIVQVRGSGENAQVRIGIAAPRGVTILRKEIYDQVKEENLRALKGSPLASPGHLSRLMSEGQASADRSRR